MTSTNMCGFSYRNRSVESTPIYVKPCFCSSGRSMRRTRRSIFGGNFSLRIFFFSRRAFRRVSRRRNSSRSIASSALAWAVMISCCSAVGGSTGSSGKSKCC